NACPASTAVFSSSWRTRRARPGPASWTATSTGVPPRVRAKTRTGTRGSMGPDRMGRPSYRSPSQLLLLDGLAEVGRGGAGGGEDGPGEGVGVRLGGPADLPAFAGVEAHPVGEDADLVYVGALEAVGRRGGGVEVLLQRGAEGGLGRRVLGGGEVEAADEAAVAEEEQLGAPLLPPVPRRERLDEDGVVVVD